MRQLFERLKFSQHADGGGGFKGKKLGPDRLKSDRNERDELIRKLFASGRGNRDLCTDFGLSTATIAIICKGVERWKESEHPHIAKRNSMIRAKYAEGVTITELKKEYHLSRNYLAEVCKGTVQTRLRDAYADGASYRQLSDKFKVHMGTIAAACKGVERRRESDHPHLAKRNAEIRERYAKGAPKSELMAEYLISERYLDEIPGIESEMQAKIKDAYADGESQRQLGADFKVSVAYIAGVCKGVERRGESDHPHIAARNAIIRAKYMAGSTKEELREQYRISSHCIKKICQGVETEREKRIRNAYAEGMGYRQLKSKFGASVWALAKICKGVERLKESDYLHLMTRNAEIRVKFAYGRSIPDLADEYCLSRKYLREVCGGVGPEIEALIRNAYLRGESYEHLAHEWAIPVAHVIAKCKGVERKKESKQPQNSKAK